MKRLIPFFCLFLVVFFTGCSSMMDAARSAVSINEIGGLGSSTSLAGNSNIVDFRDDEVLFSPDAGEPDNVYWYVGRIITPASAATRNQSEMVHISSGDKAWSERVVSSRKASKQDFAVGNMIFYPDGWADHENIPAEDYRKTYWAYGTITSVQDLFKNQIEINGDNYYIDFLRTPTSPVK